MIYRGGKRRRSVILAVLIASIALVSLVPIFLQHSKGNGGGKHDADTEVHPHIARRKSASIRNEVFVSEEPEVATTMSKTAGFYTTIKADQTPSMNSSLVILIGGLRAGEAAWETLYSNVLDANRADLALMTSEEDSEGYPDSTLNERARYIWHYEQRDDWADAVDLVNGTGWRASHLPLFKPDYPEMEPERNTSILFGGLKGHTRASGVIIFMIRYFLMGAIEEFDLLSKYNTFVVTRTDHFYLCPHVFSQCDLKDNEVVVPDGEDYLGITDRHLVAGRGSLLKALDLITPLITEPFEFDFAKHHNSERWIRHVWTEIAGLEVRRGTRVMFTAATQNDTSRWQMAEQELRGVPGMFVKYPKEHKGALNGCIRFQRNSQLNFKGTCMKCGCGWKKGRRNKRKQLPS